MVSKLNFLDHFLHGHVPSTSQMRYPRSDLHFHHHSDSLRLGDKFGSDAGAQAPSPPRKSHCVVLGLPLFMA